MFSRILAGTDGSDTANLAISHAADLARKLDADLTVVTVHGRRTDLPGSGSVAPEPVIAGALLRDVEQAYGAKVVLTTRAAEGNPADVLVDMADAEGFDLVVVGNRGIAGSSLLSPSSVPGRVARRTRAHVLVVNSTGRQQPGYARILAGTDGSSSAAAAVDAAAGLARRLGADLDLAAVVSSDREGHRVLETIQARWPGLTAYVLDGDPPDALSDLAESDRYDLLVLGNKGMTGLRRALGSVPARVLRRAPTSVLVIHTTG